ncbi:undecaprenyl-diphosphate phosphatase [Limnochorda pilosa]|uniref:Undecaprenyl-diphosphatase n=1 Tax=Limnochorda pilosa TaxID=1555112 RepID=A0A0K2SMM2_LIMPI|nr:undecaprenyl-diphosphate phosphatase [Limnochorda pilosa]BAS28378.1 hypothetical protein LIP_2548 [Limnochorda pilosa]
MTPLDAALLGVVQGLTEFLPVSSSGHLVLAQALLGVHDQGITFEVFAHFGTLLALLVVYRREVVRLLRGAGALPAWAAGRLNGTTAREDLRLLGLVALATVPAGVAGLWLEPRIEGLFGSVRLVGWMLLATGAVLLVAERLGRAPERAGGDRSGGVTPARSLAMGVGQALAIVPGLSRSGTTLSAGLLSGVGRVDAANFAFIMAIPAIGGAFLLTLADLARTGAPLEGSLLVGAAAAALSGYAAIHLLLQVVRQGRLWLFTLYTWAVGAWVLLR